MFSDNHVLLTRHSTKLLPDIITCLYTHVLFRYMLTQPDRYDVALLHLDRPVFYQENIIPICLPPEDLTLEVTPPPPPPPDLFFNLCTTNGYWK